jgi:superfamily II DNA or RNA helicase
VARREQLIEEIEAVETLLAHLAGEESEARVRLAALRAELASVDATQTRIRVRVSANSAVATPTTAEQKVKLFRQLFRGRQDVFPTRFVNKRTSKPGYAPACRNKFVRGVCELPKIKCGECPNQAFVPVDDAAILAHLRGQYVMGVYPLMEDETCWFLAVDFDKRSWTEDVAAFIATCREVGLPASVERSRSGNGAHVWFFFSEPIAAAAARKMGCYLITETMSRRHELSLDSYDRLFPSQDTMPRGGFGNLIALPLQHGPRQHGNSVFLDDNLQPYPDDRQWAHLAGVPRIDRRTVETIAGEATRRGSVIGVRDAGPVEEEELAPWTRPASGRPEFVPILGPLPSRVRAVLAQRLFVEKVGLPSPLLNQIKRLAAFQNPEFYKKQSMRLSTAMTPRVVGCAEEFPQHIGLPRGLGPGLKDLLGQHSVALEIEDQRESGKAVSFHFQGILTGVQKKAVGALLAHDIGTLVAPPGVGKTVVGTYLVAERGCSTLILVHRQPLLDQWLAQLSLFLGIDVKEIGQIGAGKRSANGHLDVAMIQSLVRSGKVADLVGNYGQVIVDECHRVPAVSFERVLAEVKARYVVGLTATPQRRDGHHPIIEMQIGPARFTVDPRGQAARGPFEHRLIVRETHFKVPLRDKAPSIQELYAALARNERRNQLVLNDAIACLEEGRSPILLTERRDHLDYFAQKLRKFARHLVVLHGGMTSSARKAVKDQLLAIPPDQERLVLATGRYIGEGFDDPRLDTLLLALPVSWRGTLVQYTGRLHRLHPGKTEVRIFDYVDREVPMLLRMFERRLRGYRAIGYAREDAPLSLVEATQEERVEDAAGRRPTRDSLDFS